MEKRELIYPSCVWDDSENVKKISLCGDAEDVITKNFFPKMKFSSTEKDFLRVLPVASVDEIKRRQSIIKFFAEDVVESNFLYASNFSENEKKIIIPNNGPKDFFDFLRTQKRCYIEKEMRKIKKSFGRAKKGKPEAIREMIEFFDANGEYMAQKEEELYREIFANVSGHVYLSGSLAINFDRGWQNGDLSIKASSLGARGECFKAAIYPKEKINPTKDIPEFLNNIFFKITGIYFLVLWVINSINAWRENKYDSLLTKKEYVPEKITESIRSFVAKKVADYEREIKELSMWSEICINIEFVYGRKGLRIKVIGAEAVPIRSEEYTNERCHSNYLEENFPISAKFKREYYEVQEEFRKKRIYYLQAIEGAKVMSFIKNFDFSFFDENTIKTAFIDEKGIPTFSEVLENSEVYKEVKEWRSYFYKNFKALNSAFLVFDSFRNAASKMKKRLYFSSVSNKPGYSFKKLFPFSIIGDCRIGEKAEEEIKKIASEDVYNFSGDFSGDKNYAILSKNKSGKTVLLHTILIELWCLFKGLPSFSEGFRAEIRDMIGSVFSPQIKGSLFDLYLKNVSDSFEFLERNRGSTCYLISDELGGGTNTANGMEAIRLFTNNTTLFHEGGRSIIFATQICESKDAISNSPNDFKIVHINSDYVITDGIEPDFEAGTLSELFKSHNLEKYLVEA